MSLRLAVRSSAAAVLAAGALALAPGSALAVKLLLKGPGLLPVGTAVTARSFNITAGSETCSVTELQGLLESNSAATDRIKFTSGTLTNCSANSVSVTSIYAGLPYTVKLSHLGTFKEKGTPRVSFVDTFLPPPGVCKFRSASAAPTGAFVVSTSLAPVVLEISNWLFTPFSSSPQCLAGSLSANFELLVTSAGPVEAEDS